MSTIVTRTSKGSTLTWAEGDANFNNLNNDKAELTDLVSTATGEGASLVGIEDPNGNFTATTVEGALEEHVEKATDAHDASAISNIPAGGVTATTVQAAIDELDADKVPETDFSPFGKTLVDDTDRSELKDTIGLQVDGLTTLRSLAPGTEEIIYLTYRSTLGDGGGGIFYWDNSNLSAKVTVDTQSGIYVAPNSDLTGASGAWVRSYTGHINHRWFGANESNVDNLTEIQAAINYAQTLVGTRTNTPLNKRRVKNVGVTLGGQGSFIVSNNVELKNGVSLYSGGAELFASSTFAGTAVLETDTVEDYVYGHIDGVRVHGNNKNIIGIDIRDCIECKIDHIHIERCGDDGIIVRAGAGAFIHQASIIGVDATAATPLTNAAGIHFVNSDHQATDVEISGYPIGVHLEGPFNRLVSVHPWSIGTTSVIMKHGFLIEGEHNELVNCVADSPFVLNTGSAPSKTNGGFGFYIDTDAVRTSLTNCVSEWTLQTGFLASTVKGFYTAKTGTNLVNCSTRDFSGLGMVITQVEYSTTTIQRATNIIGGTLVGSTGDIADLPNQFDGMFQPGASVELQAGGASTGIAYTRQSINHELHGGWLHFTINMKLTSKGTATGALTITGLPKALIDLAGTGGQAVFSCYIKNNFVPALAILNENGTTLSLINSTTGVALQDTDILNSTDFYVTGSYPWVVV